VKLDHKGLTVSVITVTYNVITTIATTLKSVREQDYPYIEHVVIDGNSNDGTQELIKSYNPAYFVSEPDDGIYFAMQKGVESAKGDILFFLNSGDLFFNNDVISRVVDFLNRTESDAVFGNLLPYYVQQGDRHDHRAFQNQKLLDLSYFNNRKLFYTESIHHQTIFYKKEIFNHCGFLCENSVANGEYYLNMCAFVKHEYKLKHLPITICKFALGGTCTSNFNDEWTRFIQARQILRDIFFKDGPDIFVQDKNEYLYYLPSLKNRIKILSRRFLWYPEFLQLIDRMR
jgi:glycosyltransferase